MKINIAVCDDEHDQAQYIKTLLEKWANNSNNKVKIDMFDSAESFKTSRNHNKAFDILMLDVQMGGQSGVALAKEIRQTDNVLSIIFITGFSDYMSEGYDVSALHYLMKPVREEKLFETLDKASAQIRNTARKIIFPKKGGSVKIKADDILYAEVFSHITTLYLINGKEEFQLRISDMENLLGEGFFKCHRSYIVSMKYVRRVTRTAMALEDGREIPLSRDLYDDANQAFIRYN